MHSCDRDTVLAALQRVAPLVRAHTATADDIGAYPPEVIDALFRERPFRLWIPCHLGGDELPLPASLEVFETAARIDGAAGWLVTIGVGGGLFAATMAPETAREVFTPPDALIAGSGMPHGHAIPMEGGYRVRGRWRFANGVHHASWVTANCVVEDPRRPHDRHDAALRVRAVAHPAEHARVIDAWHVSGMRATGSHDIAIEDEFVPEHHTFDVFAAPYEPSPLYRVPFMSIAQLSFAAVALGIAAHGVDAFVASASDERRAREDVRLRLGDARATLPPAPATTRRLSARGHWSARARMSPPTCGRTCDSTWSAAWRRWTSVPSSTAAGATSTPSPSTLRSRRRR